LHRGARDEVRRTSNVYRVDAIKSDGAPVVANSTAFLHDYGCLLAGLAQDDVVLRHVRARLGIGLESCVCYVCSFGKLRSD
jgi:hypothetical protein